MEEGKPLPEESNVDWSEATEETILDLAERLGAKYEFPAKAEYKVYKLRSSSED